MAITFVNEAAVHKTMFGWDKNICDPDVKRNNLGLPEVQT
jgi:hypothetical protein